MRKRVWLLGIVLVIACGGAPRRAPTGSATTPLLQCTAAGVEGIDVFDGQGPIDWRAVAAAGVTFAIIKATQGTYDTQSSFAANWEQAQNAGVVRGAYHFFDSTQDGVAQAQRFLSVVGPLGPRDLSPILDIECPDGDADCLYPGGSGAASAADIARRMRDFLKTVAQATGRTPIVYTFGSYFETNAIDTTGLGGFPLFLANPTSQVCFYVPEPWAAAAVWQYSWRGEVAGIAGAVDRDRLLGPLSTLMAQGAATPTPNATPTPTPTPNATPTPIATATLTAPRSLSLLAPLVACAWLGLIAFFRKAPVAAQYERVLAGPFTESGPCRRPTSAKDSSSRSMACRTPSSSTSSSNRAKGRPSRVPASRTCRPAP
ncbi:MAG: GH25 family lysozyme [Polyangiaceae bacterium]|jgi:lysozyme